MGGKNQQKPIEKKETCITNVESYTGFELKKGFLLISLCLAPGKLDLGGKNQQKPGERKETCITNAESYTGFEL